MNLPLTILLWITYLISLYFTIFWIIIFITSRFALKKQEIKRIHLKKNPYVSVIIPAYNEEDTIEMTINSVLNLNYPKNKLEIIVVNDGSTDKTGKVVKGVIAKNKGRIILINQKNKGKAASLNNALKISKGEFFACLDADSSVEPKTLRKMLRLYEKENDDDLIIVTPALKVKEPKTLLQRLQRLEYLISLFIARLMSHLDCIYVAPGPFSLYRKKDIIKLGGFDEENLTEDQEIAYRAQKYHYKIKQCYNAYVHTVAPHNLKGLYKQRNRWFKGSLHNLIKYRKLVLNKTYGDFGVMQTSINILIFFLCTATIFFISYYLIMPIFKGLRNLYLVGFDIMPYLKDLFRFTFNILAVDFEKVLILYFVLIITTAVIFIAYKNANERITKKSLFVLIPYFLFYYIILSFISVVVMLELFLSKKQKW